MGTAIGVPRGHVYLVERVRGPAWYAKYRLPDGRQVQKKLGPAWTERGRPANGYFTKRLAEDWLRETLSQSRHGTLPEWSGPARHSRTPLPSSSATSRMIVAVSHRPYAGTGR